VGGGREGVAGRVGRGRAGQGRAEQFCFCFRQRHAVFRTQFIERVLLGNVENRRTDYRSRPNPLGFM
jgi:hypothetical protein